MIESFILDVESVKQGRVSTDRDVANKGRPRKGEASKRQLRDLNKKKSKKSH